MTPESLAFILAKSCDLIEAMALAGDPKAFTMMLCIRETLIKSVDFYSN